MIRASAVAETADPLASAERRLLLVESEADQAVYWCSVFSSLGFSVTHAGTLAEAALLLETEPGLVACASHVCDGRGGEFIARVREQQRYARVYLILLTSSFGQDELIESLTFGANDCMDKGAAFGEVRARLELAERVIALNDALHEKSLHLGRTLTVLRTELESAARLQSAMLPARYRGRDICVDVFYQPSDFLGGDMLGITPVSGTRQLALGLIDVAGHGTASALISCSLMRELMDRMVAELERGEPAEDCAPKVLEQMNRRYCELGIQGMYFTALAGVVDMEFGVFRYCQAGHPSQYLYEPQRGWVVLEDDGFPVGLLPEASFSSAELVLQPGARLLAVSDGLLRPSAEDPIGTLALLHALRQVAAEPAQILERLTRFAAEATGEERDDQSAMLVCRDVEFSR